MYLEEMLRPTEWYDIFGAWSGYATILEDGTPVILYTGGRTAFSSLAEQSQNMALPVDPTDPLLRKWYKYEQNPILYNPDYIRPQDFRDPTTAWKEDDGLWRVALGSRMDNPDGTRDGVALMYTSPDFYHWNLTDIVVNRVPGTGMWECLDLFPILTEAETAVNHSVLLSSYRQSGNLRGEHYHDGFKYVMKASMDELRHDHYALGTYSLETHAFEADDKSLDVGIGLRYDWGKFYASKTFYDDSTRRRILWGYVNESDSEAADVTKGWACTMAIPRTVFLDPLTKSNLLVYPVEEVNQLRTSHSSHRNIPLAPAETWKVKGGDGNQLDVLVTFVRPNMSTVDSLPLEEFDCAQGGSAQRGVFGPFGVLVLADEKLTEQTAIFYYIHQKKSGEWVTKACSDQSRSTVGKGMDYVDKTVYGSYLTVMPEENELSLRILVDHSMVESFVQGGRFAITARVYPQVALGKNANVFLFNNGTTSLTVKSVDVYKMGSVSMATL
jgi:sucrose-6-phosphate hydrolase SacC (GH32 family)